MPRHKKLVIGGSTVAPGTRSVIRLPVSEQYDASPVSIPVQVIRGREDGPRIFLSAALHGDEINGIEIIRRVTRHPAMKKLKGTVIAVPIVNVFGFNIKSRYFPDRRDLNRFFPGSPVGSLAARTADLFMREIVHNATHGIDLHTAAVHRTNLPHLRANTKLKKHRELAEAFGVPVVLNAPRIDGTLRAAIDRRIPYLLFEGGEALRYEPAVIRAGFQGIMNVLRALGMLPPASARAAAPVKSYVAKKTSWIRASHGGIFRASRSVGARVQAGSVLGEISDPFGIQTHRITSPYSGIIISRATNPLVTTGDGILHIARFADSKRVRESVAYFDDIMDFDFVDMRTVSRDDTARESPGSGRTRKRT